MLNDVKSYFLFNEVNKKDLPAMYFTVFWCLLVVLLGFLALLILHNHGYSLHKTKSMLIISNWQGPGPVATKMPFFRRNSNPLQTFSAPAQEGNLFFLFGRSARTSRHVWLSSSTCVPQVRDRASRPTIALVFLPDVSHSANMTREL